MKYLIVLLVVGGVVWWLLSRRPAVRPPKAAPGKTPASQAIVACAHCGVHLPQAEAVVGAGGNFCTEAHRLAGPR